MFTKPKNIETAFQYTQMFSLFFLVGCALICSLVTYKSFDLASKTQQKIYILANGKVLEAFAASRKDNIEVEAKDHIATFHRYFFTLDPDEKVIQANIAKALYLADGSAKRQYSDLKENNYFSNIVSGNISQTIEPDSITIDLNQYPFFFTCKATEKIVRPTSILTRNLETQGYLRNISRSDNNPHGFLIEKWTILKNNDLKVENR